SANLGCLGLIVPPEEIISRCGECIGGVGPRPPRWKLLQTIRRSCEYDTEDHRFEKGHQTALGYGCYIEQLLR
ncbi:hypothetical protein PMAYCL1PPCAC_21955, partial [Pristionchus mayeri]